MQVIYKSVLAFKNCQAVFRSHSSGALPVLAITGFRFCCKTNEKTIGFCTTKGQKTGPLFDNFWCPFWVAFGVHFGSLLVSILGHFGVQFLVTLEATDGHHLKPRERHREELLWEPLGELPWELSWAFVGAFVRALWDTS